MEVQNAYEYPKEADILGRELQDIGSRIEDTNSFTEAEVLISSAFEENGIEVPIRTDTEEMYAKWLADFSRDFPNLIFACDLTDVDSPVTLERWYFRNGRRQVVTPYIPEFDPDDPGEEL
jgi:hypothetical protein